MKRSLSMGLFFVVEWAEDKIKSPIETLDESIKVAPFQDPFEEPSFFLTQTGSPPFFFSFDEKKLGVSKKIDTPRMYVKIIFFPKTRREMLWVVGKEYYLYSFYEPPSLCS